MPTWRLSAVSVMAPALLLMRIEAEASSGGVNEAVSTLGGNPVIDTIVPCVTSVGMYGPASDSLANPTSNESTLPSASTHPKSDLQTFPIGSDLVKTGLVFAQRPR